MTTNIIANMPMLLCFQHGGTHYDIPVNQSHMSLIVSNGCSLRCSLICPLVILNPNVINVTSCPADVYTRPPSGLGTDNIRFPLHFVKPSAGQHPAGERSFICSEPILRMRSHRPVVSSSEGMETRSYCGTLASESRSFSSDWVLVKLCLTPIFILMCSFVFLSRL